MSILRIATTQELVPASQLRLDLDAIAANTRTFAGRVPHLMAVVKADGFGHGASAVARTALANGACSLGVTTIDEALDLRGGGIEAPILSWLNPVDSDWDRALRADIDVAVPSLEHLAAIAAAAQRTRAIARVHLYLDCGLARDGAAPAEWARLCRTARAERDGGVDVVGIMGHLPCADDPSSGSNSIGRTRFTWGLGVARSWGLRPQHRHLAATSAALTYRPAHFTLARVGAGLVGIDPTRTTELRAAMTLTAPIVAVRDVRAGTGVGYGHTWIAPRATRLATLPLGYADGLPRTTSDRAEVSVHGVRCPIVGRISMDQAVVDVGDLPVHLGDQVTVWGAGGPSVAEWATWADTIEHEIVTGVGHRVRRLVTGVRT